MDASGLPPIDPLQIETDIRVGGRFLLYVYRNKV